MQLRNVARHLDIFTFTGLQGATNCGAQKKPSMKSETLQVAQPVFESACITQAHRL